MRAIAGIYIENLNYYNAVEPAFASYYQEDSMQAYAVMSRVWEWAEEYGQQDLLEEFKSKMMIPEDLKDIFK